MEQFDQEAFIAKFKERSQQCNGEGRIDSKELRSLLSEFNIQQHQKTINKIVQHLDYYRIGKKNTFSLNLNKIESKIEPQKDQQDRESDQSSQEPLQRTPDMTVNCEEALKVVELLNNKIKREIWQYTARLYGIQYQLIKLGNRHYKNAFPLKDPAHLAKVNILVGDEQEKYNSHLRAKIQKITNKPSSGQEVFIRLQIKTDSVEQSKIFSGLWSSLFEMISAIVTGQMPDGEYFLSTISITPIEKENSFELEIKSHNPELNEFLQLLSSVPSTVLKTEVNFNIDFSLEFVFDLKDIVQNPKASLYDLLTNSIRMRLYYKGSEYVTAIKELMIAGEAFKDLSYVNDDPETLNLILLISTHSVDLNLKFKNGEFQNPEQSTLMEMLNLIMEELRPLIANLEEENGDLHALIINAAKKEITVQAHVFDYHLNAELFIKNIDRLLLEDAAVLKENEGGMPRDKDSESGSND